jgi:hypothetical protein
VAYQKAITEAISTSVREYVDAHPAILRAAELNSAQKDLARALRDEDEASGQYHAAVARTQAARERAAAARAELDSYS